MTVTPRSALMAIFIVCFLTIIGAFLFQWAGYAPCPLCLKERWAYYAVIPLSLIFAGASRGNAGIARWGLLLIALILIANSVLGIYHAGAEWKFWPGPTDCSGPIGNLGSAGNLLERLDTVKVVRCDEVQFRFLGLSLAGYNVLISLLMAAIALWGFVVAAKRQTSW